MTFKLERWILRLSLKLQLVAVAKLWSCGVTPGAGLPAGDTHIANTLEKKRAGEMGSLVGGRRKGSGCLTWAGGFRPTLNSPGHCLNPYVRKTQEGNVWQWICKISWFQAGHASGPGLTFCETTPTAGHDGVYSASSVHGLWELGLWTLSVTGCLAYLSRILHISKCGAEEERLLSQRCLRAS